MAALQLNPDSKLPETGYLREKQIIGDPKASPPIPALIPIGRTAWHAGVKSGKFPKPTKRFGSRITAWRVEDIKALLNAEETEAPIKGESV